ncbi:HAD family hydrolase [Cryobacterium arcticum]|uniref:HAD family hydrolase n=1 Tax=Cryobacterium arcticum TaxID=670052 RepID=A0A317ZXY3_9MICO|nr:HAD family hydrolase [Cryobacterium arcticum]PXA72134.1 HAD family hydrolase [Cryobacterium arcticum]
MSAPRAALFDIDGTLVDSNYLHVDAWQRAFQTLHTDVEAWRIHASIGQDAGQLLTSLVGERPADWLDEAKSLHARHYQELAPRLRAFPQARELLTTLAGEGIAVVLATSAPADELHLLLEVLNVADAIHATTNADDVDVAKPEPDIVQVALDRAGVSAGEAVFVGDSRWDMAAATRAGVTPFGLRCGGIAERLLTEAGAALVFTDPADLLGRRGSLTAVG